MPDQTCPNQPQRKSLRTFTLEVVHALPAALWTRFAQLPGGALVAEAQLRGVDLEVSYSPDEDAFGIVIGPDPRDLQTLAAAARAMLAEPSQEVA